MSFIVIDCPHVGCNGRNSTFQVLASARDQINPRRWMSIAVCGSCHRVVALEMENQKGDERSPQNVTDYQSDDPSYLYHVVFPMPPEIVRFENAPENVAKALNDAERSFATSVLPAAGAGYRRTLERALKNLAPDETGGFYARIRKVEKKGTFPPALIKLMDHNRLLGNDSLHDEDFEPTLEEVTDARDFTHLFLTYTYEMTDRIEKAEAARAALKANHTES